MWMRPVLRLTEPRNQTEPSISVPENQELKKNRNSRFRFGSAPVLGFFGSVLGSRFFVPRATARRRRRGARPASAADRCGKHMPGRVPPVQGAAGHGGGDAGGCGGPGLLARAGPVRWWGPTECGLAHRFCYARERRRGRQRLISSRLVNEQALQGGLSETVR